MPIGDVAVGEQVRASKTNEIIDVVNRVGLVGVVPGSVSGTGVTVDAVGVVSVSGSTDIAVNNCFTSEFRNYRIFGESTGTAATAIFNFRNNTTDVTTANYDRTELLARNGAVSSSTNVAGSGWTIIGFANTLMQWDIDISAPNLAVPTTALSRGFVHSNPAVQNTSNGMVQNGLSHRLSTAYNGFRIVLSNNQSGTIRVYGYN